ncbi:MAG TPA: hypothetical protein PKZ43_04525 [Bacteroidales bacterium]|nr:hypothetical protein [Bacteroidales bacterium]HQI46472.1 hypothetical protein [Bacteroidales bacterium]
MDKIITLLPDTGKLTAIHAANVIMKSNLLVTPLIDLAFSNQYPLSLRAANTIEIIDSKKPELIKPYYKKIINGFPEYKIIGVKRCLLKIFTRHTDIKEELVCKLIDFCFAFLSSPKESIAIKAYSLQILYAISNKEDALKKELISVIFDQREKNSTSFYNFGNQFLKKLLKETNGLSS